MSEFINEDGIIEMLDRVADTETLESVLQKCCALVERSARQKAQETKGTGELSRSIESRIDYNTSKGTFEGVIFTPLEYAPYVEYGTGLFAEEKGRTDVPWHYKDDEGNWHSTSGMPPHPYLRPALQENREQITELLKGVIKNG